MVGLVRWVLWNSYLALLPVALAYMTAWGDRHGWGRRFWTKTLLVLLGLAWFVFLPNTCYLLTEWRHYLDTLARSDLYPRWRLGSDGDVLLQLLVYTLFYAGYSLFGMLTFALAIRPMERVARRRGLAPWLLAIPFFLLVSLGVYLGLVLRFNSWEIITRPLEIWSAIVAAVTRPRLLLLISVFGGFLWLAYLAIDIWIDGFLARVKRAG